MNDTEKLISYRDLFCNILVNELEKKRNPFKNAQQQQQQQNPSGTGSDKIQNSSSDQILKWLNTCCAKLKSLNQEHAKVLLELKQYVQFPDLYAELYNL